MSEAPAPGEPTGGSSNGRPRPRRPTAVTIVAILLLVTATLWIAYTLYSLHADDIFLPTDGGLVDLSRWHIGNLALVVATRQVFTLAIAYVAAIALLQMRRLAWLLAMISAVLVLAVQLMNWWDAQANYAMLGLGVVIVLLMNQAEVRDAFRPERER